jgi:BTB/POZ domain
MVTISTFDGGGFHLPKALLCYNSAFFEKAFNGNFREAQEEKMTLTDCSSEIFEFVIQWIFTSQVVLGSPQYDENKPIDVDEVLDLQSENVSKLMAFLKIADEIDLLGPFDQVNETIKTILKPSRSSLQSCHIRTACEIPSAKATRKLFAQVCLKEYAESFFDRSPTNFEDSFRFKKELDESDAFSAAVLSEFADMFRGRRINHYRNEQWSAEMEDPLSGEKFRVP